MKWYEKLIPYNVYAAKKENELVDLAREFFQEQGVYKDDAYQYMEDFNPSDIDIDVFEKMLTDGQVKAALDVIKLSVLAKGYGVHGDTPETEQYAEFINENFERMRGNVEDAIGEILTALEYGYSATEKVFQYQDGHIMLKKLKTLNPHQVRIKTNKFGDTEYIIQRVGSKEIKIKPEKIIWYSFDKRFGQPYGNSILRPVYKHWFIKDKIYRFANIAYERYGTPLLVGQTRDSKDIPKMTRLLKTINSMTGLAISGEDKIESIGGQSADFTTYINHHNQAIMTSMLVPPMLLNINEGQGGSYNLSSNQLNIFFYRLEALQRDIKALIEEELIRPLVELNFPNATSFPAFNFKPLAEKDIERIANVVDKMITAQVIEPEEEWIREELGFPAATKEVIAKREERDAMGKAAREALLASQGQNNNDEEEEGDDDEKK